MSPRWQVKIGEILFYCYDLKNCYSHWKATTVLFFQGQPAKMEHAILGEKSSENSNRVRTGKLKKKLLSCI